MEDSMKQTLKENPSNNTFNESASVQSGQSTGLVSIESRQIKKNRE